MKPLYRFVIILLLLVAAIAFYSYGSTTGMFLFVILGFVFEAAFWFGLFPVKRKRE